MFRLPAVHPVKASGAKSQHRSLILPCTSRSSDKWPVAILLGGLSPSSDAANSLKMPLLDTIRAGLAPSRPMSSRTSMKPDVYSERDDGHAARDGQMLSW